MSSLHQNTVSRVAARAAEEATPAFRVPAVWESWAIALASGVGVFVASMGAQWLIYDYLLGGDGTRVVGSAIGAVLTFILVQRIMAWSRLRRIATSHRFTNVAEINHHVRNSLQTILYQSYALEPDAAARIKDAVDRIEWVLERVLPQVHSDGKHSARKPPGSQPPDHAK